MKLKIISDSEEQCPLCNSYGLVPLPKTIGAKKEESASRFQCMVCKVKLQEVTEQEFEAERQAFIRAAEENEEVEAQTIDAKTIKAKEADEAPSGDNH